LDRVDPEVIKPSKCLGSGLETDISFHEGDERRKIKYGVGREMMRLEFVEVEEAPEEIRCR
jgi:hypothetical protein